jgi:hypothetical protein
MGFKSIMVTLFAVCLLASSVSAETGPGSCGPDGEGSITTSVFDEAAGRIDFNALHVDRTLRMDGKRIESPIVPAAEILAGRPSSGVSRRKRTIISVLCSAVLPGLGELYLYRETGDSGILARVPFFFAAEGYLWYGYVHNHSKGKDIKEEYMAFADEHWNLDRFLTQHPCCADLNPCDSWEIYNSECKSYFNYFVYTPREIDEEEYYENIGKYDAFVYGWDDWADQPDYWTPNRRTYWDLRGDSNKYLLRADQHLMLMLVNRLVSMVDAGLLAYRMGSGRPIEEEGWSIELDPGSEAPVLNLCYRF